MSSHKTSWPRASDYARLSLLIGFRSDELDSALQLSSGISKEQEALSPEAGSLQTSYSADDTKDFLLYLLSKS